MKHSVLLGTLLASALLTACDRPAPPQPDVTVNVPPPPPAVTAPVANTPPAVVTVPVPGPPGPPGPQGPQGDQGPQGRKGDTAVVVPVPVERKPDQN